MRFQGLKLIAIVKAIKIISKNTVLLFLLRPFIPGSQSTLQTPRRALSTNAVSLTEVSTSNATYLSYSFDFSPPAFSRTPFVPELAHTLSTLFSLCDKSPDFCRYLLASSHPHSPPQLLHLAIPSSSPLTAVAAVCIALPTSLLSLSGEGAPRPAAGTSARSLAHRGRTGAECLHSRVNHLASPAIKGERISLNSGGAEMLGKWFL